MDQKLESSNYIFPNQNHSSQGQSSLQSHAIRHQDSQMPYVKNESEGGLGSPINHPSFQQYKGQQSDQTTKARISKPWGVYSTTTNTQHSEL